MTRTDESERAEVWLEQLGCMTLYPWVEYVPIARRWFRSLTAEAGFTCSVDDCVLMISELVTNAILHGCAGDDVRVRVEWWRDGDALRVDVHDPGVSANVGRWRPAEGDEECGRGLVLVDALADRWEVGPSRFGGTRVTFVMDNAWPSGEASPE